MNDMMKNKEIARRRKSLMLISLISLTFAMSTTAFAATGYMVWLTPFEELVNSMISFMGIVGKALLGWALFEMATALFGHDTSQMPQALRRIGAGAILIFIETLVSTMAGGGGAAPGGAPAGGAQSAMAIMDQISLMI